MRVSACVVGVCAVLLCASSVYAAETMTCPDGKPSHLATAQEAAAAPEKGIIAGVTNICGSDAKLGITGDVGSAKQYLLSIAQGLPNTQAPPTKDRIDKLDNALALCAANFFKAYTAATNVKLVLRSAYRDGPNGENARAGGAPGSNHTKGLAIDVNPADGNYQKLWQYASQNPKFGVCFPYLGGDRPHLTLAGTNTGESARCARQGVTKPCDGSAFTPKNAGSARPTGALTEALRNITNPPKPPSSEYFCVVSTTPTVHVIPSDTPPGPNCLNYQGGAKQQQQAPMPAQQGTPNTSGTPGTPNKPVFGMENTTPSPPGTCAPQYHCVGTAIYRRADTCVDSLYQRCPYGCASESACVATSTATNSATTSTNFDALLGAILQATSSSSSTPVQIVVSSGALRTLGSEAVVIAPSVPPTRPETIPTTITPITDGGISAAPQTFTQSSTYTGTSERVGFLATLTDIRSALQNLLVYLQPFRGRTFNSAE